MPKNSLKIEIKIAPSSKSDEILEFIQDTDGLYFMKARVKAPPKEGKANDALIKLLSKFFALPKSNIEIISGATSKQKIIRIVDFSDEIIVKRVQRNLFS